MTKAINHKLGKSQKVDRFWLQLFEKLDILVKLQLIICPDSTFHRNESLMYDFRSLKRMYEQLSNGATFHDPATIRRFQVASHYNRVLGNNKNQSISRDKVIYGQIDNWQDRLIISVDHKTPQDYIDSMKESRSKTFEIIAKVFERWKTEKSKKFKDWYLEESMCWGKAMVSRYVQNVFKFGEYSAGRIKLSPDDLLSVVMGEESVLIKSLEHCVPNSRPGGKESIKEVFRFLASEEIMKIPFNKISSLLWACIAHQAAIGGRKRPPNIGMANDIEMVSVLLPYCDAMFVDREMFGLLSHGEVKKEVEKFGTKIFSPANKKEFLAYLDSVKESASKKHMERVREVYGEDWATPYWKMYERESS